MIKFILLAACLGVIREAYGEGDYVALLAAGAFAVATILSSVGFARRKS